MKIQKCKGSRDLLPQDMAQFRYIEELFRSCCLRWGYQEIRTPSLEYLHLFTSAGTLTPGMLSKVYSFLDWDGWSGERVVLRPEGTIPAARLYIENLARDRPAKLFYIENVFSFEETGKESRERWQCGAELIGSSNPAADVELIMLASEILTRLGMGAVELHLSHAGLIKALLQGLRLEPARQSQMLDSILNGDTTALKRAMGTSPQFSDLLPPLFEPTGRTAGFLKNLKASWGKALPLPERDINDFITIVELLSATRSAFQIDLASGKGFEYYTGVIFQFYLGEQKLAGGGRYNDLIPLLGGGDIPASGFALHIDHLMDILSAGDWRHPESPSVLVRGELNTAGWSSACEVANRLREAGYVAELDQGYRAASEHKWIVSLGKQNAPFLLTEQASGKSTPATSLTEILNMLREE